MLDCKSLPALDSERNLDQNQTMKTFVLEGSDVDLWDPTTVLLRTPLVHPGQLCHPHFELRRRRPVHLRGELFNFLLLCHWRLPWRGRWRRIRHLQLLQ